MFVFDGSEEELWILCHVINFVFLPSFIDDAPLAVADINTRWSESIAGFVWECVVDTDGAFCMHVCMYVWCVCVCVCVCLCVCVCVCRVCWALVCHLWIARGACSGPLVSPHLSLCILMGAVCVCVCVC